MMRWTDYALFWNNFCPMNLAQGHVNAILCHFCGHNSVILFRNHTKFTKLLLNSEKTRLQDSRPIDILRYNSSRNFSEEHQNRFFWK